MEQQQQQQPPHEDPWLSSLSAFRGSIMQHDANNDDCDALVDAWRQSGIPEKMFDREKERKELQGVFQRYCDAKRLWKSGGGGGGGTAKPPSEVVWLSSSTTGLGKTTLLRSLEKQVQQNGGTVIWIDCEAGCDPDPHAPLLRAMSSALCALTAGHVGNGASPTIRSLQTLLDSEELCFLCHAVPSLKGLLQGGTTEEEDAEPISFSRKQRVALYKSLFAKFIYSCATNEPCMVIMEDLHRGDELILNMISQLLRAESLRDFETPFMLVGTYCDNEVPAMPQINNMFKSMQHDCAQIRRRPIRQSTIALHAFAPSDLFARLENLVDVASVEAGDYVCQNAVPFFVAKRLEKLVSMGYLTFNSQCCAWRLLRNFPHGVTPSVSGSLECLGELSESTMEFLRIFSCLGQRTTYGLLEQARASQQLQEDIDNAVQAELLVCSRPEVGEYRFAHEALTEMIYKTISMVDRAKYHNQIAENLWLRFDADQLELYLMLVIRQLLDGRECIKGERRRAAAATLSLQAGERAAELNAYHTSFNCFSFGIELIPNGWVAEYQLCLALHNAVSEVAYCVARFDEIRAFSSAVISNARSFHDSLRAHITMIYTIGTGDDELKALAYGDALLGRLGEAIGPRPPCRKTFLSILRIRRKCRAFSNEQILRLPLIKDADKLAAMQILNCLVQYVVSADYMPIVIEKMVSITLTFGRSALSAVGFGLLGASLCW